MEETFRHADAKTFDQQPDGADAQAVHENRNGNARGEHDRALPQRRTIEIRHDERQRDQREQVAQTVAGLGDFELVLAQVDHVAIEADADAEHADQRDAELRGHQLHFARQVVQDEIRQRNGEEQQQQRQPDVTDGARAQPRDHQPADHQHQPVVNDRHERAEIPGEHHEHAEGHHGHSCECSVPRQLREHAALAPRQPHGQQRQQRAVTEFRACIPEIGQVFNRFTLPEAGSKNGRDDDSDAHAANFVASTSYNFIACASCLTYRRRQFARPRSASLIASPRNCGAETNVRCHRRRGSKLRR